MNVSQKATQSPTFPSTPHITITMSNTQATKQALSEHKLIPDVLPEGINLSYNLTLEWPNAKLDEPGQLLQCDDTKPEPKVTINPAVRTSAT
jgi:hypothetical protein